VAIQILSLTDPDDEEQPLRLGFNAHFKNAADLHPVTHMKSKYFSDVARISAIPSQVENSHYFEDAAMDDSPKRNVAATGNHHCSATA
jgi:hypothetical protein